MTTSPDTAAMAVAWSERAKAALDMSRQRLAEAEAVIEQDAPVNDPWFAETNREVYKHLLAIANAYELRADRCREAAHDCRTFKAADDAALKAVLDWKPPVPGVHSPEQGTFGGRSYDVPKCPHGCCPDAVCICVGDCDNHREAS